MPQERDLKRIIILLVKFILNEPARKAYSIFPIIDEAGKGFEYINELLQASFYNGINIGEDDYLKSTIEKLGLDWNIISKN